MAHFQAQDQISPLTRSDRTRLAATLAFLGLIILACLWSGCAGTYSTASARDSVYKVKVELTLDISSLQTASPGASESFRPAGNHAATITHQGNGIATLAWSGTGWVAAKGPGRSYLMTAGHVCESSDTYKVEIVDWASLTVKEISLPILKVTHELIARDGIRFPNAIVILDEDMNDQYEGNDLCLLGVAGDLGEALQIAEEDPELGSRAEVIGAPKGLWGGGVAVLADLKFSGRGSIFGIKGDSLAFTGEAAPGNSGSPILQSGKVVALLNLGSPAFQGLHTGVPHETLSSFLKRAMHL